MCFWRSPAKGFIETAMRELRHPEGYGEVEAEATKCNVNVSNCCDIVGGGEETLSRDTSAAEATALTS